MRYQLSLFALPLLLFFSVNESRGQCTAGAGCDLFHSSCSNLGAITVTSGTSANYNVYCITPPAGCGVITVGDFVLDQYATVRICTSSPTDTVKFVGQFRASGGGSSAANDNTRRLEVQGNVQMTFGNTIIFNSRLIIAVGSAGTLDLRPSPTGPNPLLFSNLDSIYNSGKIISNGPVNFTGPVSNSGSIDSKSITVASGIKNSGAIHSQSNIALASGANVINNGSIITEGSFTSSSGSFFDNNNYWYAKGDATFSGSYNNNSYFRSDGTLTLNASGTLDIKGGLFDSDSLILNAGNLSTGSGCAAFRVNKYSSIQNGSGISATPSGNTGILDMSNPGQIDNVATGCGGTDGDQLDNAVVTPASPNTSGPYCGIIPIISLNGAGGCFSTLPITWVNIKAERIASNKIVINWTVEENKENLLYEIQYSLDGISFNPIGSVTPTSSISKTSYFFTHENINSSDCYYRIKQIDRNGYINFSRIVAIGEDDNNFVYVFPNPATDFITIMSKRKINNLDIYTTDGRLINSHPLGENTQISISNLAKGIYFLKSYSEHDISVTRLIKQ